MKLLLKKQLAYLIHILLVVIAFMGAMSGGSAQAATYYVSTSGNDSNPGTQGSPFRHISKAASVAMQAGDTVVVMDGIYDNEGAVAPKYVVTMYYSGTAGQPITFKAQNRGKAILDSMNSSTTTTCDGASAYFNLYRASFIVIQGFVIQRGCDEGIHSNDTAHDIVIKQNEIRNIANHTATDQIGRDGIYLNSSEYNFTFDGNIFHDIGRTGGTSQLHFDHGIYAHAQHVTITNNIFFNMNRGWSIQLADGANNWLVANNTFAFGNANGEAGQIMWWGNNANINIRNNIFYNPNSSAMTQYAATITGCVFDHNLVYPVSVILSSTAGCTMTSDITGSGGNPGFVNASTAPYDFHNQLGGAGIDAGITLGAVPQDFDGTSRPQGSSTDIGAYEYGAAASAPAISAVAVSGVTSNSATIQWTTDRSSTSTVQYGVTSNYTNTAGDSALVVNHAVTLSGLAPATSYHFRVQSTDSAGLSGYSSDYTVTTAAAAFSISESSTSLSLAQGASTTDAITTSLSSGSGLSLAISSKLPAGATASLSPVVCAPACGATLSISTSWSTPTGSYNLVVTGSIPGFATSSTIVLQVVAPNIATGLVARWKFTENSGNYAYDSSGFGNNAKLSNPTWWTSNYGTTCWFSGTNSYGSVPESASLEITDQLTIAFWLRPSQSGYTDPRIISKLYDWDVKLNGAGRYPQFSSGGQYAMLNYSLPLITWHHVVFTFSKGLVKGYVDGVLVPLSANTFTASSLPNWAYGLFLATNDTSLSNPYIGSLDDVRLYNRVLSDGDVAGIYQALPRLN